MKGFNFVMKLFALAILGVSTPLMSFAQAPGFQNRVNLEDVNIQGEANKNGALFQNRNRFELDDRVKMRRDFRSEVNEMIPDSFDKLPNELISDEKVAKAPTGN